MRSELELHTTKFFELGLLGCWGVGSGEWRVGEDGGDGEDGEDGEDT
ncbi:hypothetical protein [Nostoc sp. PCC 7524]|nr:hypothetical protein [Nostoc sp. PCC 7524]